MKQIIQFKMNLPKTIYIDVADLPTQILMGVTIEYSNLSSDSLYFKFFAEGPVGWSKNSQNIGLVSGFGSGYINFDNFLSRTNPASEISDETLTFTLKAYSDSGYSTLVSSTAKQATVVFIKSDDGSWTQDELDNFDGGTVEGWAVTAEAEGHSSDTQSVAVASDYALSAPNSLKMTYVSYYSGCRECRVRIYKQFTTTALRSIIYAIANIRVDGECDIDGCPAPAAQKLQIKYLKIQRDGIVDIHIGRAYDCEQSDYFKRSSWMRFVIPLPADTTLEFRIIVDVNSDSDGTGKDWWVWLDDFMIISK
jgi:hypothetical protein